MAWTQKYPDSFWEAARNFGFVATCRTRARDIVLEIRRQFFVRFWGMDIHPLTLISTKATLDRTYPRGIHIGEDVVEAEGVAPA